LDYGFENYVFYTILKKGDLAGTLEVVNGKEKKLDIYAESDISLPLKTDEKEKVDKRVYLEKTINAPIKKGQTVGRVEIWLEGKKMFVVPLKTQKAIEENTYPYNFYKILDDWLKIS